MNHMPIVWDCHAHLQLLGSPRELADALAAMDYGAVSSACTPEEWQPLEELRRLSPDRVIPAFGLHPRHCLRYDADLEARLRKLLAGHPYAWVGESGLDRRFPKNGQHEALQAQAGLALQLRRPLVLHCVGMFGGLAETLRATGYTPASPPIILHRFTGSLPVAQEFLRRFNCYFSLHADTWRTRASRECLPYLPPGRLLVETDADERFQKGLSVAQKMQELLRTIQTLTGQGAPWPITANLRRICGLPESGPSGAIYG